MTRPSPSDAAHASSGESTGNVSSPEAIAAQQEAPVRPVRQTLHSAGSSETPQSRMRSLDEGQCDTSAKCRKLSRSGNRGIKNVWSHEHVSVARAVRNRRRGHEPNGDIAGRRGYLLSAGYDRGDSRQAPSLQAPKPTSLSMPASHVASGDLGSFRGRGTPFIIGVEGDFSGEGVRSPDPRGPARRQAVKPANAGGGDDCARC